MVLARQRVRANVRRCPVIDTTVAVSRARVLGGVAVPAGAGMSAAAGTFGAADRALVPAYGAIDVRDPQGGRLHAWSPPV
jgi:hypothetical protein